MFCFCVWPSFIGAVLSVIKVCSELDSWLRHRDQVTGSIEGQTAFFKRDTEAGWFEPQLGTHVLRSLVLCTIKKRTVVCPQFTSNPKYQRVRDRSSASYCHKPDSTSSQIPLSDMGHHSFPGALQSNSCISCFNSVFARRVQDKSLNLERQRQRERSLRKKKHPRRDSNPQSSAYPMWTYRRQTPYPLGYGGPQDIWTLHIAIKTTFRHTTRKRVIQENLKILSQQPFLSVKGHVTGCSDLFALWVIKIKKSLWSFAHVVSRDQVDRAPRNTFQTARTCERCAEFIVKMTHLLRNSRGAQRHIFLDFDWLDRQTH